MRRGVAGYPHRRPISLAQWVQLCAAGWGVSAVTQEVYEGHLRRHVLPALGQMPLELITRADIQDLVTGLRAVMSAKSAEDVMKVLSRIFNTAIDDGRISRNPCLRLKWHAVPRKRPWATPTQVLQIASHIQHWGYQLMVITAAYTGMRFGELAALQRSNVDQACRWVYVDAQIGALKEVGGRPVLGLPKTATGSRTVALPPFLAELLRLALQAHGDDFVFVGSRGAVVRRSALDKVWRRAVAETVALPGNQAIRGLHFHDLRGSHKTWLLEDGIPLVAQYERLGHRLKGVEGIYGHTTPLIEHAVIEALQRRWEESGGPALAGLIAVKV